MPPDLTRELVTDLRAWYEDNEMSQKDLAGKLNLTPQQLAEIFSRRNRPTGEQVLKIQEFLRTNNMKTDFLDPRTTPRPTASNPGPKTLAEARERIEALEAQLKAAAATSPAKPGATVPAPTVKAKLADASPTYPTSGPLPTPGADRPNKTEMASGPKAPSITLSADLDSPVKIQKVLDQMNLDDLRLALNGEKDKLRISMLYREIHARRAIAEPMKM